MANFYDPAPSTVTGYVFFRFDFFAAALDVRDIAPVDCALACRFTIIAFVAAKVLRLICCRLWLFNDNVIQDDFQLSYIVPIRPGDDDRERDATLFPFFPGPSGSDQPLPGPKVLYSWRYQYSAIPRICSKISLYKSHGDLNCCRRTGPTLVNRCQPGFAQKSGGNQLKVKIFRSLAAKRRR